MRATVRARLTIGFLVLAAIGSVVSVAILATLSRSLDELRRAVTVSDVIEHKALEMRFDVLAMSDARRGFLISSADEAPRVVVLVDRRPSMSIEASPMRRLDKPNALLTAIDLIGQYQDAGVDLLINADRRNDGETRELFVSDVMPHFA